MTKNCTCVCKCSTVYIFAQRLISQLQESIRYYFQSIKCHFWSTTYHFWSPRYHLQRIKHVTNNNILSLARKFVKLQWLVIFKHQHIQPNKTSQTTSQNIRHHNLSHNPTYQHQSLIYITYSIQLCIPSTIQYCIHFKKRICEKAYLDPIVFLISL